MCTWLGKNFPGLHRLSHPTCNLSEYNMSWEAWFERWVFTVECPDWCLTNWTDHLNHLRWLKMLPIHIIVWWFEWGVLVVLLHFTAWFLCGWCYLGRLRGCSLAEGSRTLPSDMASFEIPSILSLPVCGLSCELSVAASAPCLPAPIFSLWWWYFVSSTFHINASVSCLSNRV